MKYPNLFSPIKIGNVTFRNRIFAAPTSMPMCNPPAYLTKDCVAVYGERARGGAASVSLGEAIVHTPTGLAHPHKIRMDDPQCIPSISDAAREISQYGAVATIELAHAGKYANVANLVSKNTISGNPAYGPDHEINADGAEILEMPEEIIETIAASYGQAAARAKMCGFGMIMVHAGHGWLLQQFISSKTNHRKDKFGGSLENRMRFAMMAVGSVRKAVGPNFPIEFRMSGAEFCEGGYDIDEGIRIAKLIEPMVDLVHVSAGVHDDPFSCIITHPSMFEDHGRNVYLAREIKKNVNIPVATVGGLNDPEMLEEIIAGGSADVVEMARALLADPDLPIKAASGREDEIVRCTRCFSCLDQTRTSRSIRCTVNPSQGRQLEIAGMHMPVKEPKRVLVVGGGPAGIMAALTAAGRGHNVTICDDHETLGGWLAYEKNISFKAEIYNWSVQKTKALEDAGVNILTNTTVDREWAERFAPDVIVCAAGSAAAKPDIPGIDLPIVKTIDETFGCADMCFEKNVVVLGGGLTGCESAVHLVNAGYDVTVISRSAEIAKDAPLWHRQALKKELMGKADIRTGAIVTEIREGSVIVEEGGAYKELPADYVLCALGLVSRSQMRDELRGITPYFYEIGDCVRVGKMFDAATQGLFAGMNI